MRALLKGDTGCGELLYGRDWPRVTPERVKDIDFGYRNSDSGGKGFKDSVTLLPEGVKAPLRRISKRSALHGKICKGRS